MTVKNEKLTHTGELRLTYSELYKSALAHHGVDVDHGHNEVDFIAVQGVKFEPTHYGFPNQKVEHLRRDYGKVPEDTRYGVIITFQNEE